MKLIVVTAVLIAAVVAEEPPVTETLSPEPVVVRSVDERYPNGGYKYLYELSDGSSHEEEGIAKYVGYIFVKGSYSWIDAEGKHRVVYTAGRDGYKYDVVEGPKEASVPDFLAKIKV